MRPDDQEPAADRAALALEEYRRAVREVASPAAAASVRARAERRTTRNRALSAISAAALLAAVVAGSAVLSDRGHQPDPSVTGPPPPTGAAPCRSLVLFPRIGRPSFSGTDATAAIELINTGPQCTLSGYLGLRLQDYPDTPLDTSIDQQPGNTTTITVPTGGSAFARIAWTWSDSGCAGPSEIAVTAPGDTTAVTMPWNAGPLCDSVVRLFPLAPEN
jgi:hypothetical protein